MDIALLEVAVSITAHLHVLVMQIQINPNWFNFTRSVNVNRTALILMVRD